MRACSRVRAPARVEGPHFFQREGGGEAWGRVDPDGEAITQAWSAPDISFDDDASSTLTTSFPVGTASVALTVADTHETLSGSDAAAPGQFLHDEAPFSPGEMTVEAAVVDLGSHTAQASVEFVQVGPLCGTFPMLL